MPISKILIPKILIVLFLASINCQDPINDDTPVCDLQDSAVCAQVVHNALQTFPTYGNMTTPDLIKRQGYPAQTHQLMTKDGYILTMFRVPYSQASPAVPGKPVVFLMHGFEASSAQWVWQPPKRNLMFMLVDAGFDVWIGNARGTSYSLGHKSLPSNSTTDLRYWDFSFHEMGKYDVPAYINYILRYTGQPSLYWVGHSMGTSQFFTGMTLDPSLQPKVKMFFALAAQAYNGHCSNPVFRAGIPILANYQSYLVLNAASQGKLGNLGNLTSICDVLVLNCGLCHSAYAALFGFDPCQVDFQTLPGFLAHLPDTTSVKCASHQAQGMQWQTFRQYSYGVALNLVKYGQPIPPDYDLSTFKVPTVIYYGDNDSLGPPPDQLRTYAALGTEPCKKSIKRINFTLWDHMDFVVGKDADYYVYNDMIQILQQDVETA